MASLNFKICYPAEAVEFAKDKKIKSYFDVVDVALCCGIFQISLEYRTKSSKEFPSGILMGYKTMEIDPRGGGYSIDKYFSQEF